MNLVKLIQMCLNETYNTVYVGKHLSETFPTRNRLKQGDVFIAIAFHLGLGYAIGVFR